MRKKNQLNSEDFDWTCFSRQLLISSGVWSTYFILGLNVGTPTVLVPQLRHDANSSDAVTSEDASWLPTIDTYSGIPWVFLLPIITAYTGRRLCHIIACISTFIGYIIFYCSSNVHQIMISEVFQGPVTASYVTIAVVIVTEYTHPKYRGLFLTIKSATLYWGILVANTIGTYCHWKIIPLLGIICSLYSLFTVYFWPESPLWLAKQGRLDECMNSHRWLHGSDENSEKELGKLIADNQNVPDKVCLKSQVFNLITKVTVTKEFYKPVLLSMLLLALYLFSGKVVCTVYAIDILGRIMSKTSDAYTGMLIIDAVTVLSMYVGCGFANVFKRRSLLFTASTISIAFLYLLSLYLYLVKFSVLSENTYVALSLLIGFSVTIACGPMILTTTISGELMPIESRNFAMCLIAITFKIMLTSFTKLSPYIFDYFGMHGMFLFFGVSSTIFLIIIYHWLPETKDKTLKEIAECIKGVKPTQKSNQLQPISRFSEGTHNIANERT